MKPLAILTLAAAGLSHVFASDLDFELVNKTGRDFEAIYISASADKTWHGNLLANGQKLDAHGTLKIRFPDQDTAPAWDINIVDADGLSVAFEDVKLSGVNRVILSEKDGAISAAVE